jgi:glycosyltransferase involved in cell wall biosynthesis
MICDIIQKMYANETVAVIIPVLNEEKALPNVLGDIPKDLVDEVVVVDNGSTDNTVSIAKASGATVLHESRRGYGYPCLRGIEYLKGKNFDIIVFLDGNYSDYPGEIIRLVKPITEENYDLVLGSRVMGDYEKGALRPPVRFGNLLATTLIKLFYGFKYTDLGPFRAIKLKKLLALDMRDNLGWTPEMQVKAVRKKYRIIEVPISYRKGTGKSKFTGNIKGIVIVGYRILLVIFKSLFRK